MQINCCTTLPCFHNAVVVLEGYLVAALFFSDMPQDQDRVPCCTLPAPRCHTTTFFANLKIFLVSYSWAGNTPE